MLCYDTLTITIIKQESMYRFHMLLISMLHTVGIRRARGEILQMVKIIVSTFWDETSCIYIYNSEWYDNIL